VDELGGKRLLLLTLLSFFLLGAVAGVDSKEEDFKLLAIVAAVAARVATCGVSGRIALDCFREGAAAKAAMLEASAGSFRKRVERESMPVAKAALRDMATAALLLLSSSTLHFEGWSEVKTVAAL